MPRARIGTPSEALALGPILPSEAMALGHWHTIAVL